MNINFLETQLHLGNKVVARIGSAGTLFVNGRSMVIYNGTPFACTYKIKRIGLWRYIAFIEYEQCSYIRNFVKIRRVLLNGDLVKSIRKMYLKKLIFDFI